MWMAIKRKYQGIGIGTKLLNFIEEVVKDHGTKLIIVKTSGDPDYKPYVRTRMFYEKHGFTPLLYVDSYPEWEKPMILYVKPLC
jgi:GNAT superfamily N-acetyltransferase